MSLFSKVFSSVSFKSSLLSLGVALGVGAFVFTGIGQFSNLNSQVAASVGDQTISMNKLSTALGNLGKNSDDPARRQADIQNALNQLIQEAILVEEAHLLGWSPTPIEITNWLSKLEVFQNKETKKFDRKSFDKFLKSGRMSELDLVAEGKDSISKERIFNALVTLPDFVPKNLIDQATKRDKVEFLLEYVVVAPTEQKLKSISAEEAKKYAEDPAKQESLKKSYESNKKEFTRPAQANINSILIAYDKAQRAQGDALKRSKDAAKKLADETLQKLKSGAKFADLASQNNDDPVAKSKKGSLGFVNDGVIDSVSATAAMALNSKGELSGVLETPFGFRIIELEEKQSAKETSFEDARLELASRVVSLAAGEKLKSEMQKEVSEVLKDPDQNKLETLLKKHELSWKKLDKPYTVATRFLPELGMADNLSKDIFSLKQPKDRIATLVDFSDKSVVVRLLEKKDGQIVDGEAGDMSRRMENMKFAQNFYQQSQRKLFDMYNKNRWIQRNEQLLQ